MSLEDVSRKTDSSSADQRAVLQDFTVSFFAMCRLGSFPWRALEKEVQGPDSPGIVLRILQRTVHHPLCLKNPPSVKYRRLFLSELIKKHEAAAGAEPLDELYDAFAEVVGAGEDQVCHKSYFLPSGDTVSLLESTALVSDGTTGLVTWQAAQHLAEWAMERPELFRGRAVLELGSGAGLTGAVVCKSCRPRRYTFSDGHPSVLQLLRGNLALNGLAPPGTPTPGPGTPAVSVAELDWDAAAPEQLEGFQADTVIASDVVYDPGVICALVGLLLKLLKLPVQSRSPDVYIASTIRNPETYRLFKSELDKAGIKHRSVPGPTAQVFPYDRKSTIEIVQLHLLNKVLY
ncbi:protein-lysine N-methyltransferase EEF2KMT isoform X1 [Lepisosteus oculatus]|uniref:protein-lysine N-methyltransferase EEF2KMT isoform X1 n=1 Tax=Lepisosteus oculatus TaxID=7918 RepID=UPI0035F50378